MSQYSEEVKPVVEQVKKLMAQGNKAAAQEVVREFGARWNFPRLDAIMAEYEDADRGGKWLWGEWGPGEDLVAQATCSLKESFLEHAADLMISKGTSQGRDLAAGELGIKGAQYVAAGENPCSWCGSLDGMECEYPSEEYEKYSPPQHCGCDDCFWVYIAEEESNWNPDEEWDKTILERMNSQGREYNGIEEAMARHAHANPYWETQRANDESDVLVSLHAVERLAGEMAKDIDSEGEEE